MVVFDEIEIPATRPLLTIGIRAMVIGRLSNMSLERRDRPCKTGLYKH